VRHALKPNSDMGQVTQEIENAIKTLKLEYNDIRPLDKNEGKKVFDELLSHFVNSGDRRWWWEDFKQKSFSFQSFDKPFEILNEIIPETKDKLWLMVEDDEEVFFPIYETQPEVIQQVIGECFGFEYYIIDKNKDWLICETHHNQLIGIGEKLRIKNLKMIVD
jgi:hypothetical protein